MAGGLELNTREKGKRRQQCALFRGVRAHGHLTGKGAVRGTATKRSGRQETKFLGYRTPLRSTPTLSSVEHTFPVTKAAIEGEAWVCLQKLSSVLCRKTRQLIPATPGANRMRKIFLT